MDPTRHHSPAAAEPTGGIEHRKRAKPNVNTDPRKQLCQTLPGPPPAGVKAQIADDPGSVGAADSVVA